MIERRFLLRLEWIMESIDSTVKFGSFSLCLSCHRRFRVRSTGGTSACPHLKNTAKNSNVSSRCSAENAAGLLSPSTGLPMLLFLVGQHGVYCTSQRNPTLPAMDLRVIAQELAHAKELIQSVMEEIRKARLGAPST